MASIQFFSEKIRFKPSNPKKVISWIKSAIKKEGYKLREINYIFCTDEYLGAINLQFLRHNTYTDIITFNNSSSDTELEGDIYISIERVRENAKEFDTDFKTELHRVMIHGVLHLIGFNDKSKTEKILMRKKEDSYLSLLHNPNKGST